MKTAMPKLSAFLTSFRQLVAQPLFRLFLLGGIVLGFLRVFSLAELTTPEGIAGILLQTLVFVIGVIIAPYFFFSEQLWNQWLNKLFPPEKAEIPTAVGPAVAAPTSAIASLRTPFLLLVLPILGILLLSTSRSPLGLGFFWGVMAWYGIELWQILHGNQSLAHQYFGAINFQQDPLYSRLMWGFIIFVGIFSLGLLVV